MQNTTEFSYYYDPDDEGEKYEDEEGYIRKKKIAKTAYQWWIQERVSSLIEAERYFILGGHYKRDMWIALFEWATPDLWCAPVCDCRRCRAIANQILEAEDAYFGYEEFCEED